MAHDPVISKLNYFAGLPNKEPCSIDTIVLKLFEFNFQIKLLHWKTSSYSEHKALDELTGFLSEFTDDLIEKVIGYTGIRPNVSNITCGAIGSSEELLMNMMRYTKILSDYGMSNSYHDICSLSDDFSGMIAKTKYLLTLV